MQPSPALVMGPPSPQERARPQLSAGACAGAAVIAAVRGATHSAWTAPGEHSSLLVTSRRGAGQVLEDECLAPMSWSVTRFHPRQPAPGFGRHSRPPASSACAIHSQRSLPQGGFQGCLQGCEFERSRCTQVPRVHAGVLSRAQDVVAGANLTHRPATLSMCWLVQVQPAPGRASRGVKKGSKVCAHPDPTRTCWRTPSRRRLHCGSFH